MTDRARTPPRLPLTTLEWRLYVVVVLAGIYLIAWRAIADTTPGPPTASPARSAPSDLTTRGVWLDDLPVAQRPVLTLPPGWELAARGEAVVAVPTPRRAPASRPLRVRTRSS